MNRLGAVAVATLLAATAGGCIGSRSYVVAETLKYPVSMSSGLRGPDGHLLADAELEKVGTFHLDYTTCRMLWTIVPLKSGTRDISDDINAQVPSKGGEAVVNFSAESSATVWNVMTMVGVLPDCSKVRLRGDIVARTSTLVPASAIVPAAPAAPAAPAIPPAPAVPAAPAVPTAAASPAAPAADRPQGVTQ